MKSPAKKKIKKTKAKVKAKITPIQKAKNSVSAVAKQLAAHNKKHTAVVTRVNKAKAKVMIVARSIGEHPPLMHREASHSWISQFQALESLLFSLCIHLPCL